jgi:hypothetical protein
MPSTSNDISLPPCATMDPPFDGDSHVIRSPTTSVVQPRVDSLRAQPPFSPPQPGSASYSGFTPTYLTYHPAHPYTEHQHYIGPTPLERAYQFDRQAKFATLQVPEQPFNSHFRTPVPPLVRPNPRELPRIHGRPNWTPLSDLDPRAESPVAHKVITRPLLAKNRPIQDTERIFQSPAGPPVFLSPLTGLPAPIQPRGILPSFRNQLSTVKMEDGHDRTSAGKKRKSSFDEEEGESDTKPQLEELSRYRTEESQTRADGVIIPGVALNINGTSGFPHYSNSAHGGSRPNIASRPSGSNISLSSSPGNKNATPSGSGMASSNRTPSLTPRSFPVGISNGTINPNARGLGGDGLDLSADGGFGDGSHDPSENGQGDKAKRKKPRVALSCAQCTKVSHCGNGAMRC